MNTQLKALLLLIDVLLVVVIYALTPTNQQTDEPLLKKVKLPDLTAESVASLLSESTATLISEGVATETSKVVADTKTKGAQSAVNDGQQAVGNDVSLSDSQSLLAAPIAEKDTTRQRFLFFGDSMLEGLTRRFCDYASANGHEWEIVLWYSSSTQKWAQTNTLDYYINKFKPTYVICCLGSNELFVRDLDNRDRYIATIVRKVGKLPFVWISPPNWKPDTGINDLIVKHVGRSRYFDSTHLTLARGKDHAHPTFEAAAGWFDLVAEWLGSDQTAHPVLMNKPTKKVKWTHITMMSPDDPGK